MSTKPHRLTALLLACALLSSGASAGILAVTGAFARDGSPTTTVVPAVRSNAAAT